MFKDTMILHDIFLFEDYVQICRSITSKSRGSFYRRHEVCTRCGACAREPYPKLYSES